jgi:cell division protein ZapE
MSRLLDAYDSRVASGHIAEDPAQRRVLGVLQALATRLETPPARGLRALFSGREPAPGGVYIWGGVGRGKSMLMDLFVGSLGIEGKRRVHFHEFMQEVQAGLERARATGAQDAITPVADEMAKGLKCLALDEMQITDIADAMIVGRLFERLLEAGVAVVTTSNRPPDDLYKNGLNRKLFLPFIALLKDRLEVVELDSAGDYRQRILTGNPIYYTPADAAARAAVDGLWRELTGGSETSLEIERKGRVIRLKPYYGRMARMEFEALCGAALGPGDYLAIADALDLLVLEDIPLLSPANFDRAKRFVTLIDALYEARVRLVASAAAPPEELYPEGTGSFEFQRTASRLVEMQGADWGR